MSSINKTETSFSIFNLPDDISRDCTRNPFSITAHVRAIVVITIGIRDAKLVFLP